jgi:hypothetical protein
VKLINVLARFFLVAVSVASALAGEYERATYCVVVCIYLTIREPRRAD